VVQSQGRLKFVKSYVKNKPGVVVHNYNPSYMGRRGLWSKTSPSKSRRPYLKNKLEAKGLGMWLKC
jgi:hypothetical protein